MTTRRRLLGAAMALGVLPIHALAQTSTTTPQKYRCQSNNEADQRTIITHVTGPMGEPEYMSGSIKRVFTPSDIGGADEVTYLEDEYEGYLRYKYVRTSLQNPALKPDSLDFEAKGFTYDKVINHSNDDNFVAVFHDLTARKEIFSAPISVKVYDDNLIPSQRSLAAEGQDVMCDSYNNSNSSASSPETSFLQSLSNCKLESVAGRQKLKFSLSLENNYEPSNFLEYIRQNDTQIAIFIHDKDRGLARENILLAFTDRSLDIKQVVAQMESDIDTHLKKHLAGECPEYNSNCFLTTAASHAIGLPDDCWELETLRAFRDGPLRHMDGGRELIDHYYETAPHIVSALPLHTHARLWNRTWLFGVVPAAMACRLGLNRLALSLYRRMFNRLHDAAGLTSPSPAGRDFGL